MTMPVTMTNISDYEAVPLAVVSFLTSTDDSNNHDNTKDSVAHSKCLVLQIKEDEIVVIPTNDCHFLANNDDDDDDDDDDGNINNDNDDMVVVKTSLEFCNMVTDRYVTETKHLPYVAYRDSPVAAAGDTMQGISMMSPILAFVRLKVGHPPSLWSDLLVCAKVKSDGGLWPSHRHPSLSWLGHKKQEGHEIGVQVLPSSIDLSQGHLAIER